MSLNINKNVILPLAKHHLKNASGIAKNHSLNSKHKYDTELSKEFWKNKMKHQKLHGK